MATRTTGITSCSGIPEASLNQENDAIGQGYTGPIGLVVETVAPGREVVTPTADTSAQSTLAKPRTGKPHAGKARTIQSQ
jgi:hypothetical protein